MPAIKNAVVVDAETFSRKRSVASPKTKKHKRETGGKTTQSMPEHASRIEPSDEDLQLYDQALLAWSNTDDALRAARVAFDAAIKAKDYDAAQAADVVLTKAIEEHEAAYARYNELKDRIHPPSPEPDKRKEQAQELRKIAGAWLPVAAPELTVDGHRDGIVKLPEQYVHYRGASGSCVSKVVPDLYARFYVYSQKHPEDPANFVDLILHEGMAAVREVAAEFLERTDLDDVENNTLSFLGDQVSRRLRAEVLWHKLEANQFNLARTAVALRMKGGSAAVRREILTLGLSDRYDKACKERGLVPGVPRP